MSRSLSVSLLFTTLVAAFLGVGCRKSEEPAPTATGTDQKVEAPAAQPATKEVKLGQTMPYSGPASAYGTIGKVHAAYFNKVNREGGVNGYKINLLSLDDSYSPPKTVEQVRRLVEQEHVAAIFQSLGTAGNTAIHKYLNDKKIPHLFVSSGGDKWNDPKNFPYTIGFNPSYGLEGRIYAAHILKTNPKAKIAVLYQNDDFGKDLLAGLKQGLGEQAAKMIVAEATYETSDPTVDSQIVTLKGKKADIFVNIATPKFAAQAIRKVSDSKWKVTQYVANVGASIGAVLVPAGVDRAVGVLTAGYFKEPNDPQYDNDPAMQEFKAFMKAEYPDGNPLDSINTYAYITAQTMHQVLKQCGDDFSPENLLKQARALKDFQPGQLSPAVKLNTSETDHAPVEDLVVNRFNGKVYVPADS
jgi:branched-chain amino acid transport system substrate-binding protein